MIDPNRREQTAVLDVTNGRVPDHCVDCQGPNTDEQMYTIDLPETLSFFCIYQRINFK